MKKIIPYKKFDITIEVELNSVNPPPPAFHDTAIRHTVKSFVHEMGFVYQKDVSDLHLNGEIDKAEKEAKDFIDKKIEEQKNKEPKPEQIESLTSKGFS